MPSFYEAPIDYQQVARLHRLWEACLRGRGLSSEARISSIALNKALRGKVPPGLVS